MSEPTTVETQQHQLIVDKYLSEKDYKTLPQDEIICEVVDIMIDEDPKWQVSKSKHRKHEMRRVASLIQIIKTSIVEREKVPVIK